MSPHYERYLSDCKKLGYAGTLNQKELHKAWGIKDEEEHEPVIARKSSSLKKIKPTLQSHAILG